MYMTQDLTMEAFYIIENDYNTRRNMVSAQVIMQVTSYVALSVTFLVQLCIAVAGLPNKDDSKKTEVVVKHYCNKNVCINMQ